MEVPDLNDLLNVRPTIKLENNEVTFVDENSQDDESDPMSIMPQFVTENDLALMHPEGEILQTPLAVFSDVPDDDDTMQSSDSNDEVIVQLMDIRTPLTKLRTMLEQRLGADLGDYSFWLQDAKQLEPHRTLAAQCVRGAGVVQVNIRLVTTTKRINILDVLKPDEELLRLPRSAVDEEPEELTIDMPPTTDFILAEPPAAEEGVGGAGAVGGGAGAGAGGADKWVVDETFRADSARDKVPEDPTLWSVQHVKLWIVWAVRQFNLRGVRLADWSVSGARLAAMTNEEFKEKVPSDPGDIFWTHFELLRKCKFVAIVQNDEDVDQEMAEEPAEIVQTTENNISIEKVDVSPPVQYATINKKKRIGKSTQLVPEEACRAGNNGQIQLWQFLLELLTAAEYYELIRWHGTDGQFILLEPEKVARLWGFRKHKPAMNYEKLSRALRYYYDGDMIAKVTGQRFVYKFVCDLKQLLGYDAGELAARVDEVREGLREGRYQPELTGNDQDI